MATSRAQRASRQELHGESSKYVEMAYRMGEQAVRTTSGSSNAAREDMVAWHKVFKHVKSE